ncbi:TBC1 domain family member 22B isoform X1 [Callorhinchus milii]|uniref:TBC1 domain family member 22B n=1 Tax=Callorhinchus milii TaxID=7868 RepID=A0A4W3GM78_CALMI|nr:TBC1 domain family member 22B isoform X1 [Callorhinchus milii]|eukprot:gi/632953509/ref/XP_007892457.1/ PREDICTED: TBC1 domain family member 22B isoform X1 [Callorhinchus milii]
MASDNKRQFWKRNTKVPGSIQQVYGAQHPPIDPRLHKNLIKEGSKMYAQSKSKRASSFHEFAKSTNDAWDIGDDEEEEFMSFASQSLNSKVAMATAAQVIQNHSKSKEHHGEKTQPLQSTDENKSNGKVIKSNSEAQLSKSTSGSSGRNTLQKQQSLPLRPVIPLVARMSDQNASGLPPMTVREKTRLEKFKQLLTSQHTDLEELRKYSWSGIPREVRPVTWRLLSGYLPANMERRETTLQRKREEYYGFIKQYYDSRNEEHHQDTYRQIHIDIPRTNPLIPLFQQPSVQEIFERILFIWAIRHPASGYVQGINDLVTPFFVVFLSEHVEEDVENFDVTTLSEEVQRNIEADSFWCMSKLLDGIQDNYTFAQPGIQKKVKALEELVSRIDEQVHCHFRKYEVEYLQFAFRWMNNLLMRELPLRCTIRLWDTYQAEPEGFSHFHLYVCAAFLIKWRKEILDEEDFQGLLMLLQNLPTIHWGNEEVGLLLAEAYRLKYMFADAPNHYRR